jgi:hypothetical protein
MSQETLTSGLTFTEGKKNNPSTQTRSSEWVSIGFLFLAMAILSIPGQWFPRLLELDEPPSFQLEIFVLGIICSILNTRWYLRFILLFLILFLELIFILPSGVSLGDVFNEGIGSIQSLGRSRIAMVLFITILMLPAICVFCSTRIQNRKERSTLIFFCSLAYATQIWTSDHLFQVNLFRTSTSQLLRTIIFEPDLLLKKLSLFHTPIQARPHLSLLEAEMGTIDRPTIAITVESLGVDLRPIQPKLDELIAKRHCSNGHQPNSLQGLSSFPGFTIQMEVQQLCSASMDSFSDRVGRTQCLPRKSKLDSYAYHNNLLSFYRRDILYREMGFKNIYSPSEMGLPRDFSIPFNSANDFAVSSFIIENAKKHPGFHYWMTIDMHSPYSPERRAILDLDESSQSKLKLYDELRTGTLNSIGHMIESLPSYDFFIIGDHAPKFFDSTANAQFDRQHVPFAVIRSCEPNPQDGVRHTAHR